MAYYNNTYPYTANTVYPVMNPNYMQTSVPMQQSYSSAPQQNIQGINWVDGEIGAKAFQMPAGMTGPVALWDTNDTVIYLKSINQMGMPNPLQKIHYTMDFDPQNHLPGQSGKAESAEPANDQVKELNDRISQIEKSIQDLTATLNRTAGNNSGNNNGNRGGSR